MDVSGWTIDQRMRLPDWCFGKRVLTDSYKFNGTADTWVFGIGTYAFPDPACIWEVTFVSQPTTNGTGFVRFGLADTVPANPAEMDAATEILEHYGTPWAGPNRISLYGQTFAQWSHKVRIGLVTGGKKLVTAVFCDDPGMRVTVAVLVSALPTRMAGWLAHSKV